MGLGPQLVIDDLHEEIGVAMTSASFAPRYLAHELAEYALALRDQLDALPALSDVAPLARSLGPTRSSG